MTQDEVSEVALVMVDARDEGPYIPSICKYSENKEFYLG